MGELLQAEGGALPPSFCSSLSSRVEPIEIWLRTPFAAGPRARTSLALARRAPPAPAVPQVPTGVCPRSLPLSCLSSLPALCSALFLSTPMPPPRSGRSSSPAPRPPPARTSRSRWDGPWDPSPSTRARRWSCKGEGVPREKRKRGARGETELPFLLAPPPLHALAKPNRTERSGSACSALLTVACGAGVRCHAFSRSTKTRCLVVDCGRDHTPVCTPHTGQSRPGGGHEEMGRMARGGPDDGTTPSRPLHRPTVEFRRSVGGLPSLSR